MALDQPQWAGPGLSSIGHVDGAGNSNPGQGQHDFRDGLGQPTGKNMNPTLKLPSEQFSL